MSKKGPSQDPNQVKGKKGEEEGIDLLKRNGFIEVRKRDGGEKGFDLKANEKGKQVKIEVKGTENENEIPDMVASEFDLKNKKAPKLVADYLLVVRLRKDGTGFIAKGAHLLPKKVVDEYAKEHKLKSTIVLSRRLKNDLKDVNFSKKYWTKKR
jgi:hypothetical protein